MGRRRAARARRRQDVDVHRRRRRRRSPPRRRSRRRRGSSSSGRSRRTPRSSSSPRTATCPGAPICPATSTRPPTPGPADRRRAQDGFSAVRPAVRRPLQQPERAVAGRRTRRAVQNDMDKAIKDGHRRSRPPWTPRSNGRRTPTAAPAAVTKRPGRSRAGCRERRRSAGTAATSGRLFVAPAAVIVRAVRGAAAHPVLHVGERLAPARLADVHRARQLHPDRHDDQFIGAIWFTLIYTAITTVVMFGVAFLLVAISNSRAAARGSTAPRTSCRTWWEPRPPR